MKYQWISYKFKWASSYKVYLKLIWISYEFHKEELNVVVSKEGGIIYNAILHFEPHMNFTQIKQALRKFLINLLLMNIGWVMEVRLTRYLLIHFFLIAKPGNKTATSPSPDPYLSNILQKFHYNFIGSSYEFPFHQM